MESLSAFRYVEGNTLLHRLDPRAKLLMAFSMIMYLWLRPDLALMLPVIPLVVVLIAVGRLWRHIKGSLKAYAILGVLLVPLNSLIHSIHRPAGGQVTVLLHLAPRGTPLLGELLITREALEFSLVIYVRLVLMLLIVSVFILTTSQDEVEALLFKLRFPYFFVMTFGFAFRFIPTLALEAQRIREAQMSRGLDLRSGGILTRYWRAIVPLVLPLMVSVLRRSLLFAEALETRATFVHPRRTVLTESRFREGDFAVATASLLALAATALLLFLGPAL